MSAPEQAVYWAIVELMGHRVRAGLVSEVEEFGVKLCRIDIPTADAFVTEKYSGSSLYGVRPCSEEIARQYAGDVRPVAALSYRPQTGAAAEFEDVDEPEDDEWSEDEGERLL